MHGHHDPPSRTRPVRCGRVLRCRCQSCRRRRRTLPPSGRHDRARRNCSGHEAEGVGFAAHTTRVLHATHGVEAEPAGKQDEALGVVEMSRSSALQPRLRGRSHWNGCQLPGYRGRRRCHEGNLTGFVDQGTGFRGQAHGRDRNPPVANAIGLRSSADDSDPQACDFPSCPMLRAAAEFQEREADMQFTEEEDGVHDLASGADLVISRRTSASTRCHASSGGRMPSVVRVRLIARNHPFTGQASRRRTNPMALR